MCFVEGATEDNKANPTVHKAALQAAIKNLLLIDETPKTFEEAQKMFSSSDKSKKQHRIISKLDVLVDSNNRFLIFRKERN